MSKICFFATDERMKAKIEKTLATFTDNMERNTVQVHILELDHLISQGKALVKHGASVIIASGGTYEELSAAIKEIPILRLYISTSDILYTLSEANHYRKIYLLLNDSVLFNKESCTKDIQEKLVIHTYRQRNEIEPLLSRIPPESDAVIVGTPVLTYFPNMPVRALPIMSSESTILSIYQYARDIADFNTREQQQLSLLTTILSNVDEGIIICNKKGVISHINKRAQHFLKASADTKHITQIFPDIVNATDFMAYFQERILDYPPHTLVANASPFELEGKTNYLLNLRDVTELQRLENNVRFKLAKTGLSAAHSFVDINTADPAMTALIETAKTIAEYNAPVLIQGESGTGKELFAQSIHNASPRRHGPFVAINCAALPPELLESELFGYVGGSFTGARKEGKAGLFEMAHNGTIFLDEINSMSANIQSKLLRVLESKEVMRIGSDYVIPLDIRIISASNADILQEITSGKFRKDLYFRINTLTLNLPSLNERPSDIIFLFRLFLERYRGRKLAKDAIPKELETTLTNHHWWGNIRELQSVALRYHIFGDRQDPSYQYLFDKPQQPDAAAHLYTENFNIDLKQLQNSVERLVIEDLLSQGYTKTQVAQILKVSRQTLFNKLHTKDR